MAAPKTIAACAPNDEVSGNGEEHQADDPEKGEVEEENNGTRNHDRARQKQEHPVSLYIFRAAGGAVHPASLRKRAVKCRRNGA